jgi:shikimate dehydrogenase
VSDALDAVDAVARGGRNVTGATRVAAVIGDPIRHSRSPAIHNAAFAAAGLDWVFVAFEVGAGDGRDAVRAVRSLGLGGLSVTMPHKQDAAWACDELTSDATTLGVVNAVVLTERGRLLGASTDGEGFLRSVRDYGIDPGEQRALVLGAGGAARAIVLALANAGAEVTVAARRRDAAESAAGLVRGGRTTSLVDCDVGAHDLVVNATPLGMQGEAPPIDTDRLHPAQFVVDTVYHPVETPLLAAARARGVPGTNGLGMLVHQAVLSFELWTGVDAPLDAMRAAAEPTP